MSSSASAWSSWPIHRIRTADRDDARQVGQGGLGGGHQGRVDGVHQPAEDVTTAVRSTARMAMVMSSPMIGSASGQPSGDTAGAEHDGQRGEPVGAGMQAVGDQRGRADLRGRRGCGRRATELVAGEADQAGGGDPAEVAAPVRGGSTGRSPPSRRRRRTGRSSRRRTARRGPRPGRSRRCSGGSAARRPRTNAIHSGTAVSASETLWMVSASSATDPRDEDDGELQERR